ncbi:MAG: DUF4340 domain-containing protein [Nitrospinales bacterium]
MKFKGTLWLSVVFLATALYFFFVDLPGEEKKILSEKILLFNKNDVQEMVIEKKDQTQVLKRNDSGWEILQPVQSLANNAAVEDILSNLEDARFTRSFDQDPSSDLASYGLKEPVLKVTLKMKNREEKTLLFGDDTPIGSFMYLKRADQPKILVTPLSRWQVDLTLYKLRDKTLLHFSPEDVTKVQLKHGDESFQFIKKGDKDWLFETGAVTGVGLPHMIKLVLDTVDLNPVVTFIEESATDLKPYGLDHPAITVTFFTRDGEPPQTLMIGNKRKEEGEEEDEFYAKTNRAPNVFTVHKKIMEFLTLEGLDFLDRTLMSVDPTKVTQIHLKSENGEIRVFRDEKEHRLWKISMPIQTAADQVAVASLAERLHNARIRNYVKDPAKDIKTYGLDKPQKEITVLSGENSSSSLKIGKKTKDGKQYYVFWPRSPSVITLVTAQFVQKVFPSLHDLRLKKLLVFKSDDVGKIRVQYANRTFELEKKGQNWNLLQPTKIEKISDSIGPSIALTLQLLEFDSLIESPLARKVTGLDKPTVTVTVWSHTNRKLGTVLVGKLIKGKKLFYAQVKDKPSLYRIPANFLEQLRDSLQEVSS